ncbi:hypothetical protein NKH57_17115 [Mesorhizobium sp. M1050]
MGSTQHCCTDEDYNGQRHDRGNHQDRPYLRGWMWGWPFSGRIALA